MILILKRLNLAVLLVILSLIGVQFIAQAQEQQVVYRPRKGRNQHPNQTRKAGGARKNSCQLPLNNTVTLLVPQEHVPITVSERPTFFWYVPEELSHRLRFTLLEPGKEAILVKELSPEPGIVAFKLPESSSPLEIGKTYRWTVTVVCSLTKPSRNLYALAWIKRVAKSNQNHNSNLVVDYAARGVWYDALLASYHQAQTAEVSESSDLGTLLKQIKLGYLLQQAHLTITQFRP